MRDPNKYSWYQDERIAKTLEGKTVLVTGAGGSIGSELCRQILKFNVDRLIAFDNSELALYNLDRELGGPGGIEPGLGDVTREEDLFRLGRVDVIYHAAAYKHVTMCEHNKRVSERVNVTGTKTLCHFAFVHQARMVLVSTDKAVRPTCWMGKTKQFAEGLTLSQGYTVARLGNVAGSSGSVIPLFKEQIAADRAATVTHPDATRYFMDVEQAAWFILDVSSLDDIAGKVFVPEMGRPVRIWDLARSLGARRVEVIGLRPGEKLHEELFVGEKKLVASGIYEDTMNEAAEKAA